MKNQTKLIGTLAFCAPLSARANAGTPGNTAGSASSMAGGASFGGSQQSVIEAQQALVHQGFSISVEGVNGSWLAAAGRAISGDIFRGHN